MTHFYRRIALFGIALFLLLSIACHSGQRPKNPKADGAIPRAGGSITYRISGPVASLNTLLAQDEATLIVTFFLMSSRIVDFDPIRQVYEPSLASSINPLPDGKGVEIELRENLTFSDGRPITTDDVIFTLEAIYDPRTQAVAFRDSMLIGGKEIRAEKLDDRRFRLLFPETVASPENYLENLFVMPKQILETAKNDGRLSEIWKIDADPKSVVTAGPFVVSAVTPGEKIVLKRNPNYWQRDESGIQLPYLDELILETIPDPNNAFVRFDQGSIDILDRLRATDFASLKMLGDAVQAIDLGPGFTTDHLWFNLNTKDAAGRSRTVLPKYKWFSDKRFRRAISFAIDRDSIATSTLQGLATPLYSFVTPANRIWADPNLRNSSRDLNEAKRLLSEAGFDLRQNGDELPTLYDSSSTRVEFTLAVQSENEQRKLIAAALQRDLARIGIKVNIATADLATITKLWTKTLEYDAILQGLSVTGIDPSAYANFLLSRAPMHQWHPLQQNPQFDWEAKIDQLYLEQAREQDIQRRKQIFYEIQQIIAEQTPIVPVVVRHVTSAAAARVGNVQPSVLIPYSLWNAEKIFVRN
ncbi:MAG: hypothetical protein C4324_03260 [Blastocatellia bacterium]